MDTMLNMNLTPYLMEWETNHFENLSEKAALEEIIGLVHDRFSIADVTIIWRAAEMAFKEHSGQVQTWSRRPVFRHLLAVAKIVAELGMDPETVAAALLHDVVEECDLPIMSLQRDLGERIANIVDAVSKYEFEAGKSPKSEAVQQRMLFKKILKGLKKGLDHLPAVIVELAERLDHLRFSAEHLPYHQSLDMANQTLQCYAPLAELLGFWRLKSDLEDLAFKILYPEEYRRIASQLDEVYRRVDSCLIEVVHTLEYILAEEGIEAIVQSRKKHLYSSYRKMRRIGKDLKEINDLVAIRVIVEDVGQCYLTLGVVHALWKPISGQFDDYIACPKESTGYQSLHTTVRTHEGFVMEVQIRTAKMHDAAEYGLAAHWRYKNEVYCLDETINMTFTAIKWHLADSLAIDDIEQFVKALSDEAVLDHVLVYAQMSRTPKHSGGVKVDGSEALPLVA